LLQDLQALLKFVLLFDFALQFDKPGAGGDYLINRHGVTSIYSPGEDASGEVL
jgi:hypothetical protein